MQAGDTKQKFSNQVSLKSLTRTPSGNIYQSDLKNIFSVLLFCLNLKNETKNTSSGLKKFTFKKAYPYTFTVQKGIDTMANLHIDLQYNSTLTKLSYEINSKFAFELLQLFYTAKLLHCPDDKTCKKLPNIKHILQPTPKGIAILHLFCVKMGIPNIKNISLPEILKSNFNSIQLMEFERHSRTDVIIHSDYSDKLLFIRMMGSTMNVWSPKNIPDPILLLGSNLSLTSKTNDHIYGTKETNPIVNPLENENTFLEYLKQRQNEQIDPFNSVLRSPSPKTPNRNKSFDNFEISPFYHRFFTNPDSDSHIQYYANNGLRFFKKKHIMVDGKERNIEDCFSGKAFIQYLMDCTDIMYPKEAVKVANIFMRLKLIKCETIVDEVFLCSFVGSKNILYSLTELGLQLVKWNSDSGSARQSKHSPSFSYSESIAQESIKSLSLDNILRDPGLKYLLRKFMLDNMCVENLNVYDEIIDFQKKMKILKRMLTLKDKEKSKFFKELQNTDLLKETDSIEIQKNALKHKKLTIYTAMNKLSEYCLSKVYTIFTMYVSGDAPNEINIDSKLRLSVKLFVEEYGGFDTPCLDISELKNKINSNLKWQENLNGRSLPIIETVPIVDYTLEVSSNVEDDDEESNDECDSSNTTDNQLTECETTVQDIPKQIPNLTLNLKHLREVEQPETVSPTDILFGPKLKFLDEVAIFYEEIRKKVYRMMETDSLGKFLESDGFKDSYTSF